ncbi:hypothetical protein SDC9_127066 [bioreactor metagenome]|uniref:Uncharacterized protein n=1 Tax=bioreactor metagenome TaxID=1076179 RepID=A0A645CSY4_9ZZZZ
MIDKAIAKINAEMQKDPGNAYLEIIGHYLIDRCADDLTAARIAAGDKSLGGAWNAIMSEARKTAKNQTAVLSSEAVFDTVDRYFGIVRDTGKRQSTARSVCGAAEAPAASAAPAAAKVALNLTDFL